MTDDRAILSMLFDSAVAASKPAACMPLWLEDRPPGNVIVVGAGKAAASMAAILEQEWAEPLTGLVIVPYGHAADCQHIEVVEASHPIPDEHGVAATRRILELVSGLSAEDTVVCLLSGGGSALLCAPAPGVTLEQKKAATTELLRSGATIQEINSARRKLSAVKGGKLAAACAPANVITLIISDVPGNDPSIVASGPTIVDAASALESDVRILATSDDALQAAALRALEANINPYMLGDLAGD
ncbi:MAG: glycerate-2-kinase family protein, partial [Woeseiaceae bacterium]